MHLLILMFGQEPKDFSFLRLKAPWETVGPFKTNRRATELTTALPATVHDALQYIVYLKTKRFHFLLFNYKLPSAGEKWKDL